MAQVPAETRQSRPAREGESRIMPQSDLLEGLGNLNLLRQLGLLLGLAASVAIGFAVVLWAQGDDYRPLYASLDRLDSSEVLQILDSQRIRYRIDTHSGALMVPSDQIHEARLKLAEAGVHGERTVGFELLDRDQPLGTSQFMEDARYRRSLEGELARTIASIHSVRSARVHLAMPRQSVFLRDARKPSASVFLELFAGRRIEPEQVRAITNLVATSIPELTAENVTVVDQRGNLLSRLAQEDPGLAAANREIEYTQRLEERLARRVHGILEPVLGPGRFRAEVAADVDFTAVEQADEFYNADLPAVRSESRVEESRTGDAPVAGIPGALTNQPPGAGAAPEQAMAGPGVIPAQPPERSRSQSVRNYELDRTVSYTRHQVGRLRRLSVAVVVDDPALGNGAVNGEAAAWGDAELERIAILVRNAVGFDAARGDVVNVIHSPFALSGELVEGIEGPPWWQEPWLAGVGRQLLAALFILVLVFGVLRPVMKNLTQSARDGGGDMGMPLGGGGEAMATATGGGGRLGEDNVTLSGGDSMLLPGPSDGYEQQINAIKGLIADDPGRVAQVVKKWVASGD